jgi:hypothetical protein
VLFVVFVWPAIRPFLLARPRAHSVQPRLHHRDA